MGRYGFEIGVMKYMGWSWPDLQAAPPDVVEEIALRMQAENTWRRERQKMDEALNRR